MRYTLFLVLVCAIVMAFVVADRFPGVLEGHTTLQRINRTVRHWVGLEAEEDFAPSARHLQETNRILQEERAPTVADATCGDPPVDPHTWDHPFTATDLERYKLQLGIWKYCMEIQEGLSRAGRTKPAGPASGIADYKE